MYKKSVVCIGKAIQSFSELELSHEVQSINAHCNEIAKITHLEGLHCLRHLDVSSNKLTVISGLQSLSNLCTLNLASNFLSSVSGLGNLHGLKRINLSYNNLTSLAGFTDLHGHGYLEIIQLHGNQLGDIQTILPYLQGLLSVKHLVLKLDDAENPICNCSDYRHKFFTGLPQLTSLDEVDKLERSVNVELSNLDSDFENLSCFLPEADEDPLVVHNEGVVTKSFPMHCAHSETEVKVPSQKLTKIANTMPEKENFASRASLLQINTNFHQKKNMKSQIASDKLAMKKEKINVLKKKKGRIKEKMHKKDITASTDVYCVDKETQLSLMKQLENETERRWKAEQASKKLADVVMRKQSEASNEKVLQVS
uniref:Leucine-rich repeat and coiled-coil domain-containing protein 1 n=1 Tax=Phallusia mammillata TaxID=59560 RepID=A0A6F9DKH6_9ASCI|nr:leucine-rich repeat and coiled-coil domain-containing protein 1 [Phallusia mammillata]